MKTKCLKLAGVFLLATAMVTGMNAQSPRHGCNGMGPCGQGSFYGGQGSFHGGQGYENFAGYFSLDLTEEQQKKLQSLQTAHYKTMNPLKNKMGELKARERTLLSEEPVDMKAVNKVIDEQTDLMNQIRKAQVTHKLEVKTILTDEQIMKLEQRSDFTRHRRNGGNIG